MSKSEKAQLRRDGWAVWAPQGKIYSAKKEPHVIVSTMNEWVTFRTDTKEELARHWSLFDAYNHYKEHFEADGCEDESEGGGLAPEKGPLHEGNKHRIRMGSVRSE